VPSLNEFRFPARDADIFFSDDPGYDDDDKAADVEFNQKAVEDYLSNTLPQVYIQQAALGSGTVDPAQLATGAAGTGKAPVSQGASAPAWTDIATQAELDAHDVDTTNVHGITDTANVTIIGTDLQRGRVTTGMTGTNTVFAFTFPTVFAAVPRVTATVESGAGIGMFPTLTAVNTTSCAGFIFANSSTTATCFVHWHAVKA
jgi:hypothetical protein